MTPAGANMAEYGAVILLVSAILAAVVGTGIDQRVGRGDIAKFDVAKGGDGYLWLVSKNGQITIRTEETWR
jgi:hypothetical protein